MRNELHVTNTLTGKKEVFRPQDPEKVTLYVCGITPYDYAHLGHGRVYVTFDVLFRLLSFLGYTVEYCRNFTDIDDKLLAKAEQQFSDRTQYRQIADTFITAFERDMHKLNCKKPTYEPRVTEHVEQIIAFISALIDAGKAYVVDGDVYYRIAAFPSYGKLSKQRQEELRAGERVDIDERKESPLDFALWKREPEGTFWKSPWGFGRPGWHIECSVLAREYLGTTLDIHAGGMDLIFPHHENELAQSEGLHNAPFANYWMHNAFVRIDKEKMSKSLGNFFTLRQLFEKVDPMVIRYYLLTHHYRAPLDFSLDHLASVKKSYTRLVRVFNSISCDNSFSQKEIQSCPVVQEMLSYLCDDLNTPGMLGVVFNALDELQKNPHTLCCVKAFITRVLGLTLEPIIEKRVEITPEIQQLIDERQQARKEKDWARADMLRDQLKELGVSLQDKKIGQK